VHLQSKQVPESMGQEGAGQTASKRCFRGAPKHVMLGQDTCHCPVRGLVQVQVTDAGTDVMHERLLFRIERIAQRAEECRIGRVRRDMRAGDVSRVSERRSTRIDQQRPPG
jgi:hypothetical protein